MTTYSFERAAELASIINLYWEGRGGIANARPFVFREDNDEGKMWGVTSDLVNGLPRGKAHEVRQSRQPNPETAA